MLQDIRRVKLINFGGDQVQGKLLSNAVTESDGIQWLNHSRLEVTTVERRDKGMGTKEWPNSSLPCPDQFFELLVQPVNDYYRLRTGSTPGVGGQPIEVTHEKLPTGDGQMSPRLGRRDLPLTQQLVFDQRSFDQTQSAGLVQRKNLLAVADHAPVFPKRLRGPLNLPRGRLNTTEAFAL